MLRTASGEVLEARTSFQRDQAAQARRLMRRLAMGSGQQSSPLPDNTGGLGSPTTEGSSTVDPAGSTSSAGIERHWRLASWPPDRRGPPPSPSPVPSPASSAPPPQQQQQQQPLGPRPLARDLGLSPITPELLQPRLADGGVQRSVASSPFAEMEVQGSAHADQAAGASSPGAQPASLAPLVGARTLSEPMLYVPRTFTVDRLRSYAPPDEANVLADAQTALKGLCGQGNQRNKLSIDWLIEHVEHSDTQRLLSSWIEHDVQGPLVRAALQWACHRHWLRHPALVARLLRSAPWEALLDDAQALTHIGSYIDDIDVFRALVDRDAAEQTRLLNGRLGRGAAVEMARAALGARRQVLWDSILKPRADALCKQLVRAGRVDLLESLYTYVPRARRALFLQQAVSAITRPAWASCEWLRQEVATAGIRVPPHLRAESEQVDANGIPEQIRRTWARHMQADEVARTLKAIEDATAEVRRHTLHTLATDPSATWAASFIAHATDAERAVELWGVDLLHDVMSRSGEGLSCPLLAFGASVAGVLLRRLDRPRAYVLVAGQAYQPLWLALAAGQATLAAEMFDTIHDPRERDDVLARVFTHVGEEEPGLSPRWNRQASWRPAERPQRL